MKTQLDKDSETTFLVIELKIMTGHLPDTKIVVSHTPSAQLKRK